MQTGGGGEDPKDPGGEKEFDLSRYAELKRQYAVDLFIEIKGEPQESDKLEPREKKPLWCINDTKSFFVQIAAGLTVTYLTIKFLS